jgi:UPF0755 protein
MRKWLILIIFSLLITGGFIGYRFYSFIFSPNVTSDDPESELFIPVNSDFDQLVDSLKAKKLLKNYQSFSWVADRMKFSKPKGGRYLITKGWNNKSLIAHLRSGNQKAVKLTFNNLRHIEALSSAISEQLAMDSISLLNYLRDSSFLKSVNYTEQNIMSVFIPNTYQVYWTITPEDLLERMMEEHDRFWSGKRDSLRSALGLSREDVYTLASIVQKESNLKKEKPIIAGVYLNRLKKGMLLQADPTVVFAVGDFEIKRVLNKHLQIDSPYNTYKYEGLPPGPIGMPDISTIDAVLNAAEHNYLYFCVKPGTGFEHAFARTLSEHLRNARRYQRWLNSNRIFN